MKFLSFDANNRACGRYDSDFDTGSIPTSAVPVSDELFLRALEEADGIWTRNPETGEIEKRPLPPPTPAEIEAGKVAVVQEHMDAAARALRYDDIKTAVTYAEEPAVPKFQAEGRAFRAWRSLVWAKCYAILEEVSSGVREIPTDDELIADLPAFALPK